MKILFLSQAPPFPIYKDGLTVRVYHLLREFSTRAECLLLCFAEPNSPENNNLIINDSVRCRAIYEGFTNSPLAIVRKIISYKRFSSKRMATEISTAIKDFQPDIIFAEQTFMAQYIVEFSWLPNIISAVDAISLAAAKQAAMKKQLLARLMWHFIAWQRRNFEKKYFKKFDLVTVVAEEDRRFLAQLLARRVELIPNGVDINFFSPNANGNKCLDTVLFTGNLSAPANYEAALYLLKDLFPAIHKIHPELKFCIAGRAPPTELLQSCPPFVKILPDLADIRSAFHGVKLYVAPIEYGTGIKNSILQAMAMGVPVLTTQLTGQAVSITHGLTGFIANRKTNFVDVANNILKDEPMLQHVGTAGRQHVMDNFSWKKIADEYFAIFDTIIDRSK